MMRASTFVLVAFLIVPQIRCEDLSAPQPATQVQAAERQQLWDSDQMVQARLYMEDYFAASAQVSEQEVQEFWNELDRMTAAELKIWLARFTRGRQQRARLRDASDQVREYRLAKAEEARARDRQINAQFNRLVRQGANLSQSRVEKGFARTSKTKNYPWYPRRHRGFFWFRF
jgi:hypothetical protein